MSDENLNEAVPRIKYKESVDTSKHNPEMVQAALGVLANAMIQTGVQTASFELENEIDGKFTYSVKRVFD